MVGDQRRKVSICIWPASWAAFLMPAVCVNGEEDVKENINDFTSQTYLYTSSTHDRQMPIAKDQTKIEEMRACQCLVQPRRDRCAFRQTWFFFLQYTRYHKQGIVLHWLSRLIATASKVPNIPLHEQVVFGRRSGGCRSLTRRFRFVHFLSNGCIFSTNLRIS